MLSECASYLQRTNSSLETQRNHYKMSYYVKVIWYINASKTKVMIIAMQTVNISTEEYSMEQMQKSPYLGLIITKDVYCGAEKKDRNIKKRWE